MEPKMIQTHLKSLEHLVHFVLSESMSAFDLTEITSLKSRLKTWKKSFVTHVSIASMLKMEQERRTKVTPEDVVKFEQTFRFQISVS